MSPTPEAIVKQLLEKPESILPEIAMTHVENAQKEIVLAMQEIAKFADPEYVRQNETAFKKMSRALYPAISSSADFNKLIADNIQKNLGKVAAGNQALVKDLEVKIRKLGATATADDINELRDDVMTRIRDHIRSGGLRPGAGVAAFPAAVAAVAGAVVAAVEVVTLVRSVVSSSRVDAIIRTARINPRLLAIRHDRLLPKATGGGVPR